MLCFIVINNIFALVVLHVFGSMCTTPTNKTLFQIDGQQMYTVCNVRYKTCIEATLGPFFPMRKPASGGKHCPVMPRVQKPSDAMQPCTPIKQSWGSDKRSTATVRQNNYCLCKTRWWWRWTCKAKICKEAAAKTQPKQDKSFSFVFPRS